jgi:hypothetical protein
VRVNGNGYKLLGFAVWRGTKWYARRKLPSGRATAAGTLGLVAVVGAAALVARRAAS